jgi:hypothetical protein
LLGCDCNGLEEGVLKEKDVNVAGESGDESDDESKGFVVASQYDPAPVSPLSTHIVIIADVQTAKMVKKVSCFEWGMDTKLMYSLNKLNEINYPP